MSDSLLYSGDDAAMMSGLQRCCVAVRECSGVSSESEAGLSVGTSMTFAPECGLTFPQKCICLTLLTCAKCGTRSTLCWKISLILLNFLHCNFRLWFRTPQPFNSYPCHASEMTRNTLNHCLKFTVHSIFCHICTEKFPKKMSTLSLKLNYWSPRHQTAVFKVLICFKCS